ncbi:50S ribosomal protein L24 [Candidatus Woesearchaeota archaeon]|jgi:large subunit ribosomal protein L24|nr:50S ribosomal protein L24 [Candidatus Woesearchaeota archaeon]MBT4321728.1 50S ribosomal protein L24 [Candidatus Woesearchaeota archaeon]MBT4631180.1 50S ribosomal protein L24 [Candidatus Woesearchaeota archaeon]
MKSIFSLNWKRSKQPRKQRKYRYNAPLHIRRKFMSSPLSKELKTKYTKNSVTVIKGDTVKVLRGQFKGKSGKVSKSNYQKIKVYIEGVEIIKKDGNKVQYPIHPSNIIITTLKLEDKKRIAALERK